MQAPQGIADNHNGNKRSKVMHGQRNKRPKIDVIGLLGWTWAGGCSGSETLRLCDVAM
jgi:hypothetical protein